MENIMKNLNIVFVTFILVSTSFARDLNMSDFRQPKPDVSDVTQSNRIYSLCLEEIDNNNNPAILMNIVKQKILLPEADFSALHKPLKNIILKSQNANLVKYAATTYVILTKECEIKIDKDQLYNNNVDLFFTFINYQLPKELVVIDKL